jgi:hypothetical protein
MRTFCIALENWNQDWFLVSVTFVVFVLVFFSVFGLLNQEIWWVGHVALVVKVKLKWSRYTPWRRMGWEEEKLLSFLTSALDGGEWSASRPGRALPPGKGPAVPIVQEAGWAPEPVWTQRLEEKSSASVGDRTPVVQSVVRLYADWAVALMVQIRNAYTFWLKTRDNMGDIGVYGRIILRWVLRK